MDLVTTVSVHNEGITPLAEANTAAQVYSQQLSFTLPPLSSRDKTSLDFAVSSPYKLIANIR